MSNSAKCRQNSSPLWAICTSPSGPCSPSGRTHRSSSLPLPSASHPSPVPAFSKASLLLVAPTHVFPTAWCGSVLPLPLLPGLLSCNLPPHSQLTRDLPYTKPIKHGAGLGRSKHSHEGRSQCFPLFSQLSYGAGEWGGGYGAGEWGGRATGRETGGLGCNLQAHAHARLQRPSVHGSFITPWEGYHWTHFTDKKTER